MSNIFQLIENDEFEEIAYGYDKQSGLKAIVAIHDTTLGPAFGGTRMMVFEDEEAALKDCLKLARAMTYKNSAAGINFGGGKAVIIGDAKQDKDEALLRAYGRFVDGLAGRFIAGVDVGTDGNDMVTVKKETDYVTALPRYYGGAGSTSGATAYGVYKTIERMVERVFGESDLGNKTIGIQGAGSIGWRLAEYLSEEGSKLYISDIDKEKLENVREKGIDFESVAPEKIYDVDMDIFAPCALGGILNDDTIPRLKCELVAGSANNVLKDPERHSKMLEENGIVYGVDFIMSAGGVINNSQQYNEYGYTKEAAYNNVAKIADNMEEVIKIADEKNITTWEAAYEFAKRRLNMASNLKKWYLTEEKSIKV